MNNNFDVSNFNDVSLDFTIHLEYSFVNGLKFSLVDENGSILFSDSNLHFLLRHLSAHINSIIFSTYHAF